ncbi:MAG: hypothetical protein OXE58_05595, partial [Acidobacteria bacterium]|nr:hypothetical protein [Acidobacteriota bacterium]
MSKKVILAFAVLLAAVTAAAQEDGSESAGESRWESDHSIMVDGETIEYDAVVASTTLTDNDGEDSAKLFYTAYFRTNGAPSQERP